MDTYSALSAVRQVIQKAFYLSEDKKMYGTWTRERLQDERRLLLCKLEKYEDSKNLDAWNDTWSKLSQINRILELCP